VVCVQVAAGRLGNDADSQERLEPISLLVQQANLDDVEVQQILGEVQDVGLEQVDPLVDRHVGDDIRRQVGQLHAGLVDGGQLLLLQHLAGHVADGDDQVVRRLSRLEHRRGMHLIILIVAGAKRRAARTAGG
jgi:hypothetical protein